jgi:hypothetical protein
MPKLKKPKRKKPHERENWFWNGFVTGAVLGSIFAISALGYSSNLLAVTISRFIIVICFLLSLPIILYNAYCRRALKSPLGEGMIAGIGFAAQAVEWAIHGIHFP